MMDAILQHQGLIGHHFNGILLTAGLIASSACSDALLIFADAIEEVAATLAFRDDRPTERVSLRVLTDALRAEAPAHAANGLFPERTDG